MKHASRFARPRIVNRELPEDIRSVIEERRSADTGGAIVITPPHLHKMTNYDLKQVTAYWMVGAWVVTDDGDKPFCLDSICIAHPDDTNESIAGQFLDFLLLDFIGEAS